MATTARCMLPVGLAVGHSRSGSGSRSQSQMLARSQSQALTCRCCRPCARVRSCVIPGAYPAAPWWRSQARRGPCPPTPMTVQATRTQEHDDAPFRCNTLDRALLAILRPRPRPPLAPPTERGRRHGRRKAHPGPIPYCPPNWNGKWRTAQGSGTWRANCRTPVDEDIDRHPARLVWPWGGRVGSVSLGRDRDG